MGKRRNQSLIDSDSSDNDSASNLESDLLSLAKKRKNPENHNESSGRRPALSGSDSESDWGQNSTSATAGRHKKRIKKVSRSSCSSEEDWDKNEDDDEANAVRPAAEADAKSLSPKKADSPVEKREEQLPVPAMTTTKSPPTHTTASVTTVASTPASPAEAIVEKSKSDSEHEEGEVSDSDDADAEPVKVAVKTKTASDSGSSDSSSDSEFDDGYDENLMGDDEDRKRLNGLSEKERETEIFKRIEQRDIMRTRWEIERKLKLARRGDKPPRTKASGHKRSKNREKKKHKLKEAQKLAAAAVAAAALKKLAPIVADAAASQSARPQSESETPTPLPSAAAVAVDSPAKSESQTVASETNSSSVSPEKNASADEQAAKEAVDYFDHKERSKERKKNVEMNRTDDKRSNAMALLKAKREGKAKREEEEAKRLAEKERDDEKEELDSVSASGKSAVKLKASEIYSDDSGSSDWDDEKPSGKRSRSTSSSKYSSESEEEAKPVKKAPVSISTRDELNKLRLSRFKMERFVNLPIFERIVMNCFVRISIGNNGQKPVYRVGEIVGVVETAKIYSLGKTRTNRGLRLKHGSQERVFRLEFISNQEFTTTEFEKWREMCAQHSVPMPSIELIERKQKDIKEALNYEYKDEDVDKIVEEKNRFRNRPTNYAMRKTCLMKERDAAMLRGDYDIAQNLGTQIEELESRASELDKKRSSSISLISYINDRNRKRNVEDAEKAIMEEARANKGQKISDPFTRRITQPRMGFKSVEKKPEQDVVEFTMMAPPPPGKLKLDNADAVASGSKANVSKDYSLYSLHDFDIDLEVTLPVNSVNVVPKPHTKVSDTAPKRLLNLEDYKKKRGLI